jgi:tRNA nucleotidyltransferase/poly(A) polymerase
MSLTCGCAARALRLQSCGYKALIVGGWVRDKYLGRRASDIDIATNATTWEVRCCQTYRIGM